MPFKRLTSLGHPYFVFKHPPTLLEPYPPNLAPIHSRYDYIRVLFLLSCQKDKESQECITVIFFNNLHPFFVFDQDFGSQLSSHFADFLWDSSFLTWSILTIWWKKFDHCLLLSDCQWLLSRLFPFSVSRRGRKASVYFFRVPLKVISLKEPKWDSLLFLISDLVRRNSPCFENS